jgi:superfamily II DNA or RNA helicase/HKD family nuclease
MPVSAEKLRRIKPKPPLVFSTAYPDTPLAFSALLTGSSRSPALRTQLIKELETCDRADWIVSFIKYSGIVHLLSTLRDFTNTPLTDGSPKLRVATTSYLGATDLKAIEALLELPNTEVRISYDSNRTRLHAKAYLFHRETGFGSAYIGSANVSKHALDEGLEWTAKISEYETEHLWKHAVATFESHWEDSSEFSKCTIDNLDIVRNALSSARNGEKPSDSLVFFDLRPYGFQQAILEDIWAERSAGIKKHLVIAATGTGKTMVAAFDYKAFSRSDGKQPPLLFVAHRKEILEQAIAAFRHVLRDGSFGELIYSGNQHTQTSHLFCTVQSWNSREFDQFAPTHFAYVVLDEAHHAAADSYQKLIDHVDPKVLLGLTATPERADGKSILADFGGAFTHELRLPEAIDRALLSPFHYYGVPDLEGLDFSGVSWRRGGYDQTELKNLVDTNERRANWVMSQAETHVADITKVRGIGFCVSIKHAQFMAAYCNDNGIPCLALTSESSDDERKNAKKMLEQFQIRFIFTVDLFNEGIDIPCIDTVLFLRPTESLTVFLQQLGRGLRLHEDKSNLTVLDFIAPQHSRFSYAKRFQALTSRLDIRIDRQIENDLPFAPAGSLIHLEKQAKQHILENIRRATENLSGQRFFAEFRQLCSNVDGEIRLQQIIDHFHLDSPDVIYRRGIPHRLIEEARGTRVDRNLVEFENTIKNGFRRVLLTDDTELVKDSISFLSGKTIRFDSTPTLLQSLIWTSKKPGNGSLSAVNQFLDENAGLTKDLIELLEWIISHRTPVLAKRFEKITGPLVLHASYSRSQVLLAIGEGTFENQKSSREGTYHYVDKKLDLFFADINKRAEDFSPTTMYDDYAINDQLFHWQSQSQTSQESETGQRYINHIEREYTPLLFIREHKKLSNDLTSPYFFAGPLRYNRHSGSKPVSFVWELAHSLPAKVLEWAKRAN